VSRFFEKFTIHSCTNFMDAHKISSQNSMLFERQKWQTCVLDALPDKINHDLSCSIAIFLSHEWS
jgi:hypothetical protein